MIPIHHIDHIVLRVVDAQKMLAFYAALFGCTVERHRPELGLYHLRAGNALIDLVPVDGPLGKLGGAAPAKEGRNVDHFCLRIRPSSSRGAASTPRTCSRIAVIRWTASTTPGGGERAAKRRSTTRKNWAGRAPTASQSGSAITT